MPPGMHFLKSTIIAKKCKDKDRDSEECYVCPATKWLNFNVCFPICIAISSSFKNRGGKKCNMSFLHALNLPTHSYNSPSMRPIMRIKTTPAVKFSVCAADQTLTVIFVNTYMEMPRAWNRLDFSLLDVLSYIWIDTLIRWVEKTVYNV